MEDRVRLSIDGREVVVPKGTTILAAAAQVGIDIPHLCYLPGFPPSGACRLCLVEVEGQEELAVSCAQPVREGMVVFTRSARAQEARRFVLELLWSTHPGDCATCEKNGACALQKYTYELGIDKTRFPLRLPDEPTLDSQSLLIERDLRLCILCGRCIRICQEQGQSVLDFMRRGIRMVVTTPRGRPLQEVGCDFCGSCIAVCPVGCLVEKDRKHRGREWEFTSTSTPCPFCSAGCELILDLAQGRIVRARPGRDGYLCARGKFGWDFLEDEGRIRTPLIREGDGFREATWEEALQLISSRLSSLGRDRPGALGGLVGGWLPTEAVHLFAKLLQALGANALVSSAQPWVQAAGLVHRTLGSSAHAGMAEVEAAEAILAVGAGLGEAFPRARVAIRRAKKRGAKLVVVDPLDSELVNLADLALRPRPGTEAALLGGLIRSLLFQGLQSSDFLSRFPSYLPYDQERVGVPQDQVDEAARLLAQGRLVVVLGVPDLAVVEKAAALLLLLGRVERSLVLLSPHANFLGIDLVVEGSGLSQEKGAWAAVYALGADPAHWLTREELESLEFLVIQDLFFTETARLAHVVLPLPGPFGEEGSFVLGGELVRLSAITGGIPSSWAVLTELAKKLLLKPPSLEEVEREVSALLKHGIGEPSLPTISWEGTGKAEHPFQVFPHYAKFELPEGAWSLRSKLAELPPGPYLAVGGEEAEKLGVRSGELVRVCSPEASAEARVWVWEAIPPGFGLVSLGVWRRLGGRSWTALPAWIEREASDERGRGSGGG